MNLTKFTFIHSQPVLFLSSFSTTNLKLFGSLPSWKEFLKWKKGPRITPHNLKYNHSWFLVFMVFFTKHNLNSLQTYLVSCGTVVLMVGQFLNLHWFCFPIPLLVIAKCQFQPRVDGEFGLMHVNFKVNPHLLRIHQWMNVISTFM